MAVIELLYNQYLQAVIILIISLIIARIIHVILKNYIPRFTGKTKTDIDDIIIEIITKPVYFFMLIGGLFLALTRIDIVAPYMSIIDDIFFIISVLIAALVVSRIVSALVSKQLKVQKRYQKTPQLLNKIIMAVIYIIAILAVLGHFNVEITPIIAALGLGGLAVGLALQQTLSNFFAGLHILSDRPINVGDYIELQSENVSGYVDDIGWRSTKIKTLPNNTVIIPNSKVAESTILNDDMPEPEMSVVMQCGVGYGSDLEKVEKVTTEVATEIQKKTEGAVKDFKPFIMYHTFGESNINFSVILRVKKFVNKYAITHEFIKALKKRYDKEGIEISWPVRKVYKG